MAPAIGSQTTGSNIRVADDPMDSKNGLAI